MVALLGLLVLVGAWSLFALLGAYVAREKGRPGGEGAALGFLFGPVGCVVEALLPTLGPPGRAAGADEPESRQLRAFLDAGRPDHDAALLDAIRPGLAADDEERGRQEREAIRAAFGPRPPAGPPRTPG